MINNNDFSKRILVVVNSTIGQKFRILNDNLIVENTEKTILQITCYRIFALYIIGDCTITTPLLNKSKKFGFSIVFFSYNYRLQEIITLNKDSNTLLRKKQYSYSEQTIANLIIYNKTNNQIRILNKIRTHDYELNLTLNRLKDFSNTILESADTKTLLAYEGNAAKIYFSKLFEKHNWIRREPRVKNDFINSALDIGYTILFSYVESILSIYGFDLFIGIYHKEFYMRKSLVCDLVEPFRCIIDDTLIKALNLKQISIDHFTYINNQYILKYGSSQKISQLFFEAINKRSTEIFQYIQSYYRFFMGKISSQTFPVFEV